MLILSAKITQKRSIKMEFEENFPPLKQVPALLKDEQIIFIDSERKKISKSEVRRVSRAEIIRNAVQFYKEAKEREQANVQEA